MRTDDYIRPRGYFDNKGNKLNVNFDTMNNALSGISVSATQLNGILYGSSVFKYAMGSTVVSNGMTMSHGLTSAVYCVVNACTGGVIAGGHVSGSSITFYVQANAGIFFETTSATVDWIAFGN